MGWSFECESRPLKEFLADRTRHQEWVDKSAGSVHVHTCLAKKYVMSSPRKGRLWVVWQAEVWDPGPDRYTLRIRDRFIGLDLIQWGGRVRGQGSLGWGYKDICESMGPCEVDCPEKYLEMVPDPEPCKCVPRPEANWPDHMDPGCGRCYAAGWRRKVRVYHAKRRRRDALVRRLQNGDRVYLRGCSVGAVVFRGVKPLRCDHGTLKKRWIDTEKTEAELDGKEAKTNQAVS